MERVRPKELMPHLVSERFFKKDDKFGKPLRDVLNMLDKNGLLHLIPQVRPERQEKAVYWYFESVPMEEEEQVVEKDRKSSIEAPKKTVVKKMTTMAPSAEKTIKALVTKVNETVSKTHAARGNTKPATKSVKKDIQHIAPKTAKRISKPKTEVKHLGESRSSKTEESKVKLNISATVKSSKAESTKVRTEKKVL